MKPKLFGLFAVFVSLGTFAHAQSYSRCDCSRIVGACTATVSLSGGAWVYSSTSTS